VRLITANTECLYADIKVVLDDMSIEGAREDVDHLEL